MKQLILALSLSILVFSCGNKQHLNRYLPEAVHEKIHFGLSLEKFTELKGDKVEYHDDSMPFRSVYFESVEHTEISYFGYYFDEDGTKPLYEIIIGYKNESLVKQKANELLGQPNYKDVEWKIERDNDYDLLAWIFKEKLIITALIPETEWYEDQQN